MEIHIQVLGSSSSGNSTLIWNEQTRLLIDFGFGIRYLQAHLVGLGLSIDEIDAALITHTHYDHVKPTVLKRFAKNQTPVYCTPAMQSDLLDKFPVAAKVNFRPMNGAQENINDFLVQSFEVPHDVSGGCVGYSIRHGGKKIVLSTDLGFIPQGLDAHFLESDLIIIESNYDPHMLENSNRPWELIERIKTIGHLSNGQSANFVVQVVEQSDKKPKAVALAHLSQECNTPGKAVGELRRRFKEAKQELMPIEAIPARRPGPVFTI